MVASIAQRLAGTPNSLTRNADTIERPARFPLGGVCSVPLPLRVNFILAVGQPLPVHPAKLSHKSAKKASSLK
jgi:hypothetical protein